MKTIVCFGFVLGALSAAGKEISAISGGAVTINCGADTFRHNLEWHHGSDRIYKLFSKSGFPIKGKGDIVGRSKIREETNLEISRLTEGDAGQFVCIVDGTRYEHTLVVGSVSVSVRPSQSLQWGSAAWLECQVRGLSSNPPVQWKGPGRNQPIASHTAHLESVARSDAGTWECTFSLGDQSHSRTISITVVGPPTTPAPPQDGKKTDHKTACPSCATKSPSESPLLLGLSWWMWVAVGVGGLVAVLLMVLVIVLYKRIKTRKRKLHKMKNSRQPLTKQYCQCNRPTAAAKPQQGRRREKSSALPLQPLLIE